MNIQRLLSYLLLLVFTLTHSLMGQEYIYDCNVLSRLVGEDGLSSAIEERFPTKAQKAADADRGVLKIVTGQQKASHEIALELLGGTLFHAFKFPKSHHNGDHIVFKYSHPVTKQIAYQVFPVGMPRMELIYGHIQQPEVGGIPEDPYEHYANCTLRGVPLYGLAPKEVKPSDDEFACKFTLGTLDTNYQELHMIWEPEFIYHYNQDQESLIVHRDHAYKEKDFEITFSNLGPVGQTSLGHAIDFSEWRGWGQRWNSDFEDYLVDPKTLKPTGERIGKIKMRLVNPVNKNAEGSWIHVFYDLDCNRSIKPQVEEEDKIDFASIIEQI